MKKKRTVIIILLFVGLIAVYLIVNKFKPPIQHVTMNPAEPSQPYGYDVPVQADSPWPRFAVIAAIRVPAQSLQFTITISPGSFKPARVSLPLPSSTQME